MIKYKRKQTSYKQLENQSVTSWKCSVLHQGNLELFYNIVLVIHHIKCHILSHTMEEMLSLIYKTAVEL